MNATSIKSSADNPERFPPGFGHAATYASRPKAEPQMPLKSSIYPARFGLVAGAKPLRGLSKHRPPGVWGGYFSSPKAKGPAPFESLLERDLLTLLSVDPRIKEFAVQPHRLIYWMPGANGYPIRHGYIPDVVAVDRDGHVIVIDAKASRFANDPKWSKRQPLIDEAYSVDHNATFLVLTEEEIRAQPRLTNCQIIYRYRGPPDDLHGDLVMRQIIGDAHASVMLGQLCLLAEEAGIDQRRSFSALMRLFMSGFISIDLSEPISPSSCMTLGGAK
jgi:hypothetical protein